MAFSPASGARPDGAPAAIPRHPYTSSDGSGAAQCRLALAIASAAFAVAPEEIGARARRHAGTACARHVAIYLAHVVFQLPMGAVAEGFGRDRASVRYAVRRIEDRRDDAAFDRLLERLEHVAAFCRSAGSAPCAGATR